MRNTIAKFFLWYSNNIEKIISRTCIISISVLFIGRISLISSYEGHLAGIDNNFDYPIIRSLAGYSIYPDPNSYPFAVNPYAPLYFIVCKWVAMLFHVSANNTFSVYQISRSVALIADTCTTILFFYMLRTIGKSNKTTSTIITAFFYIILCYLGYTFNRADCIFLFFYCCSLFFLFSGFPGNKLINNLLMAFFVTLTIFSKQNGISLLLLVPVWLILKKNFKHALLFFLFTSILSCCAFYYFQYIFTNQVFSDHIFHALKNKIDPHWFYVYIFKLIAESPLILPLIIALGVSMKAIANNLESFIVRLGILFIIQFFFSSALAFKWGSSLGYFNESFLIGFLLISAYVTKYTTEEDHKFIRTINTYIYPAFLIFVLHVTLQFYFYFLNDRYKNKIRFEEQVKVSNYIKKEIGNKDNYIINLYSPNSDFFKALLFRVNAAPNFDAVNCCTLPGNLFDYRQLLEGLRNGKILYLIEKEDNKEKALWGVSLDNYKIDTTLFGYTLYKFAGKTQKYN